MDIIKQYIIQCISVTANNLRLNNEKIEVVALLKYLVQNTSDVEQLVRKMKGTTEFSKFGIKLTEILNYISSGKIDFLKISEKFKEHCHFLLNDLSIFLDIVTPEIFQKISVKLTLESSSAVAEAKKLVEQLKVENDKNSHEELLEREQPSYENKSFDEMSFNDYETHILEPIKDLDLLLRKLSQNDFTEKELKEYQIVMERNSQISQRIGFEIIANMHKIFSGSLKLIIENRLIPVQPVIEAMRACLIVIVAVIRNKDVDIKEYLNRAEKLGIEIKNL